MPKKVVSVTATRYEVKKVDVKVASTLPSSGATAGASDGPAEITDIAEKAPLLQGATPAPLVPPTKKAPSKKAVGKRAPAKKAAGEGKKKKRSTKVGIVPVYRNIPAEEIPALPRLSAFPTFPPCNSPQSDLAAHRVLQGLPVQGPEAG